ncbi:MAG TPA: hypothetical protein V6D25_12220 [Leptolyngbyaceae cyanobacterium]
MINQSHSQGFSQISQLLSQVNTDRVQILIPIQIEGKEIAILTEMHHVVNKIKQYLPPNWLIVSYGVCDPRCGTAIGGEGVDIVLHRRYSSGCTITRFHAMSDLSLVQIV